MLEASAPARPAKDYAGLIWALICGAALLIAAAAAIGAYRIAAVATEPSRPVAAYLSALQHGEASKALKLDGTKVTSADVLLTNKVYRSATNRITAYKIRGSEFDGDRASVTATYTQGGTSRTITLQLRKVGRYAGLLDEWRLQPVRLGIAHVTIEAPSTSTVTVYKGADVHPVNGHLDLRALPGQYEIDVSSTKWYDGGEAGISISGFGTSSDDSSDVTAELTQAGNAAAFEAVNRWITACGASHALVPPGCSFGMSSQGLDGVTLTNKKWTMQKRPSFTVGLWDGSGWPVTMLEPGAASFQADASAGDRSGTVTSAGTVPVKVGGTVVFDQSGAVFTSRHWYSETELQNLGGASA